MGHSEMQREEGSFGTKGIMGVKRLKGGTASRMISNQLVGWPGEQEAREYPRKEQGC